MPKGVTVQGVPADTVTYNSDTGGTFAFSGTADQYDALLITFPADFSTQSPNINNGLITGTLTAQSTEDTTGQSAPIALRITPEGDVEIDDSLPDLVPDETDDPTPLTPADLLQPAATDRDGSEAIDTLTLTIDGLPANATLDSLNITLPNGATTQIAQDGATGATSLTITLNAQDVGDVNAAYDSIALSLPADFSTTNRSDLINGNTALPITLTLNVQTDEDQNPATDTPTDGTATAQRSVDIDFEHDIEASAPILLVREEDSGTGITPEAGAEFDLELDIAITDQDGSETADPSDPRFAADVAVTFFGLPANATVNDGTIDGDRWTGTVAQANALVLRLPQDYHGVILNQITVTTPEGRVDRLQILRVTPTPDIEIAGEVRVDETDDIVPVLLADFISVVIGEDETVTDLVFDLDGLPTGTEVRDSNDNPIGTFTDNGDGTSDFLYIFDGVGTVPVDAIVYLPRDYSKTSPLQNLSARIVITTDDGTVAENVPFIVEAEGDVSVSDGTFALSETDAPVQIRLADQITAVATDIDGSESVVEIGLILEGLPPGSRISIDNGTAFADALQDLEQVFTPEEFAGLILELPADFSTENPETALVGRVLALTDEGGLGEGTLTITLDAEGDVVVTGPGRLDLMENDAPGVVDEDDTTQAPIDARLADAVSATASDADGSESIAEVDVSISGLPSGALYSVDNGSTFEPVPDGLVFELTALTEDEYQGLIIRLPDDYSTTADITGRVTFTTDEALLAGETDDDATDGIERRDFVIAVASEQDVLITAQDITVVEDLGSFIPFNLDAAVTDIDGSETITGIQVDFAGLPSGDTQLTNGVIINGPMDSWTGTLTELRALGVVSFPEHFSGIIDVTVTINTNEGNAAGTS